MRWIVALLLAAFALPAAAQPIPARYNPQPYIKVVHPGWARQAVLYQINTRQFTPEGTFRAAEKQLPRLKALGVDVLWLMPINPIGDKNRKGTLGSPYSVRDYYGVNPEFGTLADLKHFLAAAHAMGFHVILDWVANHTAWDNKLVTQHPDWYDHDWKGRMHPTPWLDWSDIIDLNYDSPGLRQYMTQAMAYWVRAGFDGFRCDVAGMVPVDFWNEARAELDRIKPVFLLAEWNSPEYHARAFDASYAWDWWDAAHAIGTSKGDAGSLSGYYSNADSAWPAGAMRMLFLSNHDKNAWDGSDRELFGPAFEPLTALSFVSAGVPLIYNGQEAGNDKRLAFFERDPIAWRDHPNAGLYRRLIAFRRAHPALDNPPWGAPMVRVINDKPDKVFSFVRAKGSDRVLALFNFSGSKQEAALTDGPIDGNWRDADGGATVPLHEGGKVTLAPWSFRLLTN